MGDGVEKCLDSELWHACAGAMVQMPQVNSKVFYFPQGHVEHTLTTVDFGSLPRFPPMILCRVVSVKFLADRETDEVYAKIRLVPVGKDEPCLDADVGILDRGNRSECSDKPASFAKTLTQSDANNGGGFSVPRYCAETIFPPLDFKTDPPVQNVMAKDVHGLTWKFRHIYRGTPRRHLLTTGWSTFVNQKKLVAGDSIVFLKAENGDLCVGIRRAKKNSLAGGNNETSSLWNSNAGNSFAGLASCLKGDDHKLMKNFKGKGRIKPESVIEATFLASSGQPFEVAYYPCANTPEFCVNASSVSAVTRIQWSPGMRFKMAFETEDSSRISWFLGTVSRVQFSDPVRWPNSPWRMLQVNWDEPDLLQNVNCVSPWLVEMVPDMPVLHISPFSPSRKKLRFTTPHHHPDFPLEGQFPIPPFSGKPLSGPNSLSWDNLNISAGIQGTRHVAQIGIPLPDFHLSVNNKMQMRIFPSDNNNLMQQDVDHHQYHGYKAAQKISMVRNSGDERVSCMLSVESPSQIKEKRDDSETPQFVLFGKIILTEEQMCNNAASDKGSNVQTPKSDGYYDTSGSETDHCKVFLESEDVGRTLDLSVLGSYDELYKRLEDMFGIEESEMHGHVLYRDVNGEVKQAGEEPFGEFAKAAKRLTIFTKPTANNRSERKLMTGFQSGERGLDSSNRAGPMSIFV